MYHQINDLKSYKKLNQKESISTSIFHIRDIYTIIRPLLFACRLTFSAPYYLTKENELKVSKFEAVIGPIFLFLNTVLQSYSSRDDSGAFDNIMKDPYLLLSFIRNCVFGVYFMLHAIAITRSIKKVKLLFQKFQEVNSLISLSQRQLRKLFGLVVLQLLATLISLIYLTTLVAIKELDKMAKIRFVTIIQDSITPHMVEVQFQHWIFIVGIYVKTVQEKLEQLSISYKLENNRKLNIISG